MIRLIGLATLGLALAAVPLATDSRADEGSGNYSTASVPPAAARRWVSSPHFPPGHGLHRPQVMRAARRSPKIVAGLCSSDFDDAGARLGRPFGRRCGADRMQSYACPMPHIALRGASSLSTPQRRAGHDPVGNAG